MPKSIQGVMREFKKGELHSGRATGTVVTNRRQAVAIALSEQRTSSRVNNLGKYAHPKKGR